MSAKPNYTKGQINSLPLGPLKEALEALGLPFNGGKIAGWKSLKAALYPDTVAVSQPNPSQLPSSQPPGAPGSASQPNVVTGAVSLPIPSPLPSSQPSGASGSASQPNLSQGREQWHLLTQTSGPVYTRIPVASRDKASYVYSTLLNKLIKAKKDDE